MNDYESEELLGLGDDMSAMQEERYLLTMLEEVQRIIDGKSAMLLSSEHCRAMYKIIKNEAPNLFNSEETF